MGKIAVCVLSFHPLVLPAVCKALPERDFEIEDYRVPSEPSPSHAPPPIPDAAVYIVETHARLTLTEAEIARVASLEGPRRTLAVGEGFDDANVFPLLRKGVKGFVTFAQAPDQLERAVRALTMGGFWVPRAFLSRFIEETVSSRGRRRGRGETVGLTPRERQILDGVLENLSNKEIATRLGISERGVKFHVSNILAKNDVRRRQDLILLLLNSTRSGEAADGAQEDSPPPAAAERPPAPSD